MLVKEVVRTQTVSQSKMKSLKYRHSYLRHGDPKKPGVSLFENEKNINGLMKSHDDRGSQRREYVYDKPRQINVRNNVV